MTREPDREPSKSSKPTGDFRSPAGPQSLSKRLMMQVPVDDKLGPRRAWTDADDRTGRWSMDSSGRHG
jgi:hypothetical protein